MAFFEVGRKYRNDMHHAIAIRAFFELDVLT